jgi:hypothetical protein
MELGDAYAASVQGGARHHLLKSLAAIDDLMSWNGNFPEGSIIAIDDEIRALFDARASERDP